MNFLISDDHEKFLDHLYNVIAETNVIEQSSFAMRVIKTCFDVLTASLEDRIPKRVAEKGKFCFRFWIFLSRYTSGGRL